MYKWQYLQNYFELFLLTSNSKMSKEIKPKMYLKNVTWLQRMDMELFAATKWLK